MKRSVGPALLAVGLLTSLGSAHAADAKPDEPTAGAAAKKDDGKKDDGKKDDGKKKDLLSKIFEQGEVEPVDRPTKDTYRDSFAFGLEGGGLAGLAEGFPNDPTKQGRPEFFASTGPSFGGMGTFWLGGALRDFVNFGFGFTGGLAFAGETRTPSYAFILRIEGFPTFPLGGAWRDLGVGVDLGVGTAAIERQSDGATLASGGAVGKFGLHVFWEGLRVSKLAFGPIAGFDYAFSGPMSRPFAMLGFRMAFYAKP